MLDGRDEVGLAVALRHQRAIGLAHLRRELQWHADGVPAPRMRSRSLAICLQEKVDSKSRVRSGAVLYFTIGEATALSSSTFKMSCHAMPPLRASARLSAIIAADTAIIRLTASFA